MITYLRGLLSELSPTNAIIDCGGVGYLVGISLNTYSALSTQSGEVKLHTVQIIREDSHQLYGFASKDERELFVLLTSVSGIGPNTARVILSQYNTQELGSILSLGQVDALKAVKGIGLKTAQRIILELKGKLKLDDTDLNSQALGNSSAATTSKTSEEAISALKMLGYPEAAAQKTVRTLISTSPLLSVEDIIKQALKLL
ncbi:MAG: Holliday junction branch migration protein RuvA [Porphyromonas sp.]|nr:Holliday junction branch migration protein RuvA [Porphyromonas sp.]